MSVLYMINGPLSGRSFEIDDDEILIGRALENHIQVVEQSISRSHAKILKRENHYLGSWGVGPCHVIDYSALRFQK